MRFFTSLATASIISSVGCGTMKVQLKFSGAGEAGDKVTSGVLLSVATCDSAMVAGTPLDPISTSTRSSVTSLRPLRAALVASDALSRMMNLTGSPAMVFGISSKAFL